LAAPRKRRDIPRRKDDAADHTIHSVRDEQISAHDRQGVRDVEAGGTDAIGISGVCSGKGGNNSRCDDNLSDSVVVSFCHEQIFATGAEHCISRLVELCLCTVRRPSHATGKCRHRLARELDGSDPVIPGVGDKHLAGVL
jgi:hypothetical protein